MRRWRRGLVGLLIGGAASGCSSFTLPAISIPEAPTVPSWVPWLGTKAGPEAPIRPTDPKELLAQRERLPEDPDTVDRVICVVNNDAVTLYELDEAEAAYLYDNRGTTYEGDARQALRQRLLDSIIQNRMQLQQAEREKISIEESELTAEMNEILKKVGARDQAAFEAMLAQQGLTVESFKKRLRNQLMVQRLTRRKVVLRISVTEQEIDRYIEDNRDKLETGLTFEARHILFLPEAGRGEGGWDAARQKAERVHALLMEGKDFAELAREHSEDGSGKDGGSLGALKRGELAPEIEQAILALSPGRFSAPFRSQVGYHVFRLDSRDDLTGAALTQVRGQIRDILFREKYEVRMKEWLADLRQRSIIDVRL
jgi:peptidyl-prolyl cis-trans isomerase SurA